MIKGRLGLRWRGALLITLGLAAPLSYIIVSGGPGAQKTERVAARPGEVDAPAAPKPGVPPAAGSTAAGSTAPGRSTSTGGSAPAPATRANDGIRPLPPDDDGR